MPNAVANILIQPSSPSPKEAKVSSAAAQESQVSQNDGSSQEQTPNFKQLVGENAAKTYTKDVKPAKSEDKPNEDKANDNTNNYVFSQLYLQFQFFVQSQQTNNQGNSNIKAGESFSLEITQIETQQSSSSISDSIGDAIARLQELLQSLTSGQADSTPDSLATKLASSETSNKASPLQDLLVNLQDILQKSTDKTQSDPNNQIVSAEAFLLNLLPGSQAQASAGKEDSSPKNTIQSTLAANGNDLSKQIDDIISKLSDLLVPGYKKQPDTESDSDKNKKGDSTVAANFALPKGVFSNTPEKAGDKIDISSILSDLNNLIAKPQDGQKSEKFALSDITVPTAKTGDTNTTTNTQNITPQIQPQPILNASGNFAKAVVLPNMHPPVAEQVLVHIKTAVNNNLDQIKVQLSPENLGKIEVQITTDSQGKVGVNVTADNRNTLAMLQNDAKHLQDALRDIGLKTDGGGLNFNLREQGQDPRNQGKQGGYTYVNNNEDEEDFSYPVAGVNSYRLALQTGLDIRI